MAVSSSWLSPTPSRLSTFSLVIGGTLTVAGLLVITVGWILGYQILFDPVPGASSMKINTALGIVLIGLSIVALVIRPEKRWLVISLGAILAILSFTTLIEYAFAVPVNGFENLIWTVNSQATQTLGGRMGVNTAAAFAALSIAIILAPIRRLVVVGQWIVLLVLITAYLAFIGYVMDVGVFTRPTTAWTQMAIHTSIAILLACAGLLALNPRSGWLAVLTSSRAGGRQARILVPVVFLISIVLAASLELMVRIDLDQPIPAQVVVSLFTLATLVTIWFTAWSANKADAELQGSRSIEFAMEHAPDGVLLVSPRGVIQVANSKAAELTQVSPGDLVGSRVEELVPPKSRDHHAALRAEYQLDPESRNMRDRSDIELQRADGSTLPVDIELAPIVRESGETQVFVSIRDRSELVQANQELEQFAYVASHDLRAPLRTISGFTDLLAFSLADNDALSEDDQEAIDEITTGVKRMNDLISALLNYSRIGQSDAPHTETSVSTLVDSTLDSLAGAISDSDAEITTDIPADLCWTVDASLMGAAIQNLISNSIKYRRTDVRLRISVTAQVPGDHGSTLTVRDNGQGIDPTNLSRATAMFQRLTTTGDGLGIGLATVNRIVENVQGTLELESDGATFTQATIRIPNRH